MHQKKRKGRKKDEIELWKRSVYEDSVKQAKTDGLILEGRSITKGYEDEFKSSWQEGRDDVLKQAVSENSAEIPQVESTKVESPSVPAEAERTVSNSPKEGEPYTVGHFGSYNEKRYSNPWLAKFNKNGAMDFYSSKDVYTGGSGEEGDLIIPREDMVEGNVFAWGQKDYRRNGSSKHYAIFRGGKMDEVSYAEAKKAAMEEKKTAKPDEPTADTDADTVKNKEKTLKTDVKSGTMEDKKQNVTESNGYKDVSDVNEREDVKNGERENADNERGVSRTDVSRSDTGTESAGDISEGVQKPVRSGDSVQTSEVGGRPSTRHSDAGDSKRNEPGPSGGTGAGDDLSGVLTESEQNASKSEPVPGTDDALKKEAEHKEQIVNTQTETARGSDFRIGETLDLPSGEKSKYKANIEAIKILKNCLKDGRYATPEEQIALSKYVGWGGLANAFDRGNRNWTDEYNERACQVVCVDI